MYLYRNSIPGTMSGLLHTGTRVYWYEVRVQIHHRHAVAESADMRVRDAHGLCGRAWVYEVGVRYLLQVLCTMYRYMYMYLYEVLPSLVRGSQLDYGASVVSRYRQQYEVLCVQSKVPRKRTSYLLAQDTQQYASTGPYVITARAPYRYGSIAKPGRLTGLDSENQPQ